MSDLINTRFTELEIRKQLHQFVRRVEQIVAPYLYAAGVEDDHHSSKMRSDIVISCQLVLYNPAGKTDLYRVFDLCHERSRYSRMHEEYFKKPVNKSIVSIFQGPAFIDRGWLTKNLHPQNRTSSGLELDYLEHVANATYENFRDEKECDEQWENWAALMFQIYPFAKSVFSENLPIRLSQDLELYSAIFLSFLYDIDASQRQILALRSSKFLASIALTDLVPELYKNIEKQATRAAISQVMARNMSHNIGSHVLSKFKAKEDILTNNSIQTYTAQAGKTIGKKKAGVELQLFHQYRGTAYEDLYKNEELRNENQIAYFNDYLKNRMDFLADVATSDPVMENSLFFRSEIFKGFDRNRILLNRISGVSDPGLIFSTELCVAAELKNTEDIPLSMTNDILGAQALYIILENIIRNVCKHSKPTVRQKQDLIFTIKISDWNKNKAFYEISIYDNLPKKWIKKPKRPEDDEIGDLLVKRNTSFTDTILKDEGREVRPTSLGTIEMDVCAAYLRCLPIDTVEKDDYKLEFCGDGRPHGNDGHQHDLGTVVNNTDPEKPRLMFAYKQPYKKSKNRFTLGYKFYIGKPKQVLVIDDKDNPFQIAGVDKENLQTYGIVPLRLPELTKRLDDGEVFKHQFIYFHSEVEALDPKYSASLPKRTVNKLDNESFPSVQDFMGRMWETYAINHFLPNRSSVLIENSSTVREIANIEGHLNNGTPECTSLGRILIDDHNRAWCQGCFVKPNPQCQCRLEFYQGPPSLRYYDMACGHSRVRKYREEIRSEFFDGVDLIAKAEYLEVVFSKIVVLDERIQENLVGKVRKKYEANDLKTDFYRYFRKQGLVIPLIPQPNQTANAADLNAANFGRITNRKDVAYKIKRFITKEVVDAQFCVLHLGLVEKMLDSNAKKNDAAIFGMIRRLFNNIPNFEDKLIITSGRGTPNNLPKEISFVPLAPVQNAIETVFDKFVLTKLLFNARRTS